MVSIPFDASRFVETLTDAGISEPHAKAIADGFKMASLEYVATKDDIVELRNEMHELRIEMRDMKISLLMWIVPLLLGQTALFAAIVKWL